MWLRSGAVRKAKKLYNLSSCLLRSRQPVFHHLCRRSLLRPDSPTTQISCLLRQSRQAPSRILIAQRHQSIPRPSSDQLDIPRPMEKDPVDSPKESKMELRNPYNLSTLLTIKVGKICSSVGANKSAH